VAPARSRAWWILDGHRTRAVVGVATWALLIVSSAVIGNRLLTRPEPDMDLDAPPLFGRFDLDLSPGLLVPMVVALVLIGTVTRWRAWPWRRLLVAVFLGGIAWAVALAASDGFGALATPLTHPADYLAVVPVDSAPSFMRDLVAGGETLPLHVRAHPPGAVLLFTLLSGVGWGGPGAAAVIVIAAGASAGPAALVAVRSVAGEHRARSAAPFLVLAPAAVWAATSMDGLFMGVSAWAVAALVVAVSRRNKTGDLVALGGGVLFGCALFLSYGVAVLAVVPLIAGVSRRFFRPLVIGAVGALAVAAAFAYEGFWWWEGLTSTLELYREGVSRYRPGDYFLIANLAALAVALGPAVAARFALIAQKRLLLLTGAALVAVLLADASGFSKGEVERIWLPFVPWLLLAAGASDEAGRPWYSVQAGWAILIQAGIRTPW
jgi:methylthioxylose transferase